MKKKKKEIYGEKKQEVIKHSAAIQIENNITLLQRRIWNALLYNAYNDLKIKEEYDIFLAELARLIGYDSHDMEYLQEAALAMLRCIVQYNLLGKDGSFERWGATALLAQADIQKKKGLFTYAYSPELRRRLHNPEMYARLDLNLQRQFDSKYALALWELCADYLGAGREYGESPFIPLTTFRKLMGITEKMYPAFMRLNEKVIKPALTEVNRVSDFDVTMDAQRKGRKVLALKFKIRRVTSLPELKNAQKTVSQSEDEIPLIVRELQEVGLSTHDAREIWLQGFRYVQEDALPSGVDREVEAEFVQYIREKIHLLKKQQTLGKVSNPTGFLLQAIRTNYANPAFQEEQERQVAAAKQRAKEEQDRHLKILANQKTAIEKACEEELEQVYRQIVHEAPTLLDNAVTELLKDNNGFRQFYDRKQSAPENYQASKIVRVFLNPCLEHHASDRITAIKQRYTAQIEAIVAQMACISFE